MIAFQSSARRKTGQVAAGVGLGVALAPDDLGGERGLNEAHLLFLGGQLQERRHEVGNALPSEAGRNLGLGELLGDDVRLQRIKRRAEASVLFGHGASDVTAR